MTVDVNSVNSIASRMQLAQSTLSNLGSQLANVAPTGGFDQVLAEASATLQQAFTGGTVGASSQATRSLPAPGMALGASGATSPGASVSGSDVVADATRYLGVPYQWGGTDPGTGLDCSGLVQRVYGDLGVALPRTSQEQATIGAAVPDLASARPGDLVFFEPGADGPGHVGIYVGNGKMIDAPHTGASVEVDPVGTPSAIRRVLPPAQAATVADNSATTPNGSGLNVPSSLAPLFLAAAGRSGVPATLLAAVAKTESNFNPQATSSAGAEGIMQLMPSTAAGLGVDPFDPAQAINGAAQMLSGLVRQFGSVPLALAAYNAGPGAVQQYGGIPPYPETQAYVQRVMALASGSSS